MKISIQLFLGIVFLLCFLTSFGQRVIVIGFDGFSAEGYKAVAHPNIDRLVSNGVLSLSTRPVMPSVTLPNWTSHLTGSGPEEHGVVNNGWTVDKKVLKPLDADAEGYYPSIFKVLKEQPKPVKTAFYYNWAELINSMNKKYFDDLFFQYQDRFDSLYNRAYNFILANKEQPQLVFLYSVHTDHAGHHFGWMSSPYKAAIVSADSAVGALIHKLKDAGLYEDTYFLLITDHGGIEKGHGGVSMQEMQIPWAITGPGINKKGLQGFFNSNKNTSAVLARIFGVEQLPPSWTGVVPDGIFQR
ncbi:alkaline phosphatase [Niabella terrae]